MYRKKSNGRVRKANGTTDLKLIPKEHRLPPYANRKRRAPADSIVYYDVDKEDIRSFKENNLLRIIGTKTRDEVLSGSPEEQPSENSPKQTEQTSKQPSEKPAKKTKEKFINLKKSSQK